MNRRDMLLESVRSAIGVVPAVMGIIPGLAGVLRTEKAHKENAGPACFPSPRVKANPDNTSITHDEEGK